MRTIQLEEWQVDLILDSLSLLDDLESGNGTNEDYDPNPIAITFRTLQNA
jgi:hypothetical protein